MDSPGIIARPLTNLLKKGKFSWNEDATGAFDKLKSAMTTTPTLALPNFEEQFVIETDASGDGIGVVLSQKGRPLAFMSRSLGVAKQSWSTYAREMLAIVVVSVFGDPISLAVVLLFKPIKRAYVFCWSNVSLHPSSRNGWEN